MAGCRCRRAWPTCRPSPLLREGRQPPWDQKGDPGGPVLLPDAALTRYSRWGSCSPGPPLPERKQQVGRHPRGEPLSRLTRRFQKCSPSAGTWVMTAQHWLVHQRGRRLGRARALSSAKRQRSDRPSPGKDAHVWPRASRGPWGHGRPGLGTLIQPGQRPALCPGGWHRG